MKKFVLLVMVICLALTATACGPTKILHCDNCQKEISVAEDSNMEEDWIIYCKECNEELFGDDPLLSGK